MSTQVPNQHSWGSDDLKNLSRASKEMWPGVHKKGEGKTLAPANPPPSGKERRRAGGEHRAPPGAPATRAGGRGARAGEDEASRRGRPAQTGELFTAATGPRRRNSPALLSFEEAITACAQ